MNKRLIALFVLMSAALMGQPAQQLTFYKLDFLVKEVEGTQALSSKSYSTMVAVDSSKCLIRAGTRVPVLSSPGSTSWNYIDIGTSIDCDKIKETGSGLSLSIAADISTIFRDASEQSPRPGAVVRQNRWSSEVTVPFKKTTLLFTADDPGSKQQLQLELTVTPVK